METDEDVIPGGKRDDQMVSFIPFNYAFMFSSTMFSIGEYVYVCVISEYLDLAIARDYVMRGWTTKARRGVTSR